MTDAVTPEIIVQTAAMLVASAPVEPADLTMDDSRPTFVTVERSWLALLALELKELDPYILDETRDSLDRLNAAASVSAGVYFVRSGDAVKIGMSGDIPSRIRALRTMSPLPLELLGAIPGGRTEEAELHRAWAGQRMHGEWFKATPDLIGRIAGLCATAALKP